MNREVLTKHDDQSLRIYTVWVPKQRGLERDVPAATTEVKDPRAAHYWDAPGVLVRGYRETLKLSEDAWDIYLLYGPDARWEEDLPPAPLYWVHQLGSKEEPRLHGPWLDGAAFLERLRRVTTSTRSDAKPAMLAKEFLPRVLRGPRELRHLRD